VSDVTAPALRLEEVTKRFGGTVALDDVTVDFDSGQIHAVIGPNGAGKSTLQGVVSGEHRIDRGRVMLFGNDVTGASPRRINRFGLSRAFQIARVFPDITVAENVTIARYAAEGHAVSFRRSKVAEAWEAAGADDVVWPILQVAGLDHSPDKVCANLSQGQRKLLEVALAVASHPRLLLLDEPTAGMTSQESNRTIEVLVEFLTSFGITMILTEHDMDIVFRCADRLVVMELGRVVFEGDPQAARADPEVLAAYLGSR